MAASYLSTHRHIGRREVAVRLCQINPIGIYKFHGHIFQYETSDGLIDITIKTHDNIYIIELKYDGNAEDVLRLIPISVNFSSKTRCIEDWSIK